MNTIILATGKASSSNICSEFQTSQLMSIVNGKPIISWALNDFLKKTSDTITIVLQRSNKELIDFIHNIYSKNKRFNIFIIENSSSILDSCKKVISFLELKSSNDDIPLRIVFADTLLLKTRFVSGNHIYISDCNDLSKKWCMTEINNKKNILLYDDNKHQNNTLKYKVLLGRYEFSNQNCFKKSLDETLIKGKTELSDLINVYEKNIKQSFKVIYVDPCNWIDFCHLEGIHHAQKKLMESRAFNFIEISTPIPLLTKKSTNKEKLEKEYLWYNNLPNELKVLSPQIIEYNTNNEYSEIKMEYYGYSTLTEKFVYSSLPSSYWLSVLKNIFLLINKFQKLEILVPISNLENNAYLMYYEKTYQRIYQLKKQRLLWKKIIDEDYLTVNGKIIKNINLLCNEIKKISTYLSKTIHASFIHGDLCFNNILFDDSRCILKLIDPRGQFGNLNCNFGDIRYDIAKIRHSFVGGYDHIIEGFFDLYKEKSGNLVLSINNINESENENIFNNVLIENGFEPRIINFIESLLFISMTPLHNDSIKKQIAFYLHGLMKLNEAINNWEK